MLRQQWVMFFVLTCFLVCVLSACDSASSSAPSQDEGDTQAEDALSETSTPDAAQTTSDADAQTTDSPTDDADQAEVIEVPPVGPLVAKRACEDATEAVYGASRAALGAADAAKRGEVLACAVGRSISGLEAQTRLNTSAVLGVVAGGDIQTLRIAYRTERRDGSVGVSSALVYLPQNPPEGRRPLVVVAHGTIGVGDGCAPSSALLEGLLDYLALPWAAAGYPVIATDYAGLGTEGVQGYGDNIDTGRSVLDAARALRALLPAERLSEEVFLVGHSQGGGAVLSAQALNKAYGCGGLLAGVVSYAPGWMVKVDTTPWQFPLVSTAIGGGYPAAFTAMFLYGYAANALGEDQAGAAFPVLTAANLTTALETQCLTQLAVSVPTLTGTFYGLVDETFRQTFVDCADNDMCEPPGDQFTAFMRANILHADPEGAPILLLQGLTDIITTPADVACVVAHLQADQAPLQVCVDASPHTNVAQNNVAFALQWVGAVAGGQNPPTCNGDGLPTCQ